MSASDWVKLVTIPFFTGAVGWLINWTGLIMLFNPVRFHGFRIPGLQELSTLLPRKLQEIPGIMQGGIGWQGIVPARAAKMGSIAVDKAIAKLGTPGEFYQQLEPDEIGVYIDQLLDPKLMVIDHFQRNPALVNRIFRDVGQRELRLMVNFGFLFGFLFGIPVAIIDHFAQQWWLLPILGVIVGWMTNLLGM